MTGTYRIFLILAVLAVSRVCHAMDDHIWEQLGDLPEAARELSSWHEFNPGQSLHPNDDTSAHFSGQHPGPSSFAFVPHSHTPSSSHAGQVIQAAESHWRPFPEGDPILHFDTATGLPKHPQPLTIRERKEILQPIADRYDKVTPFSQAAKSTIHPFKNDDMTEDFMHEAIGAGTSGLFRISDGTYIVPKFGESEYALSEGGFPLTQEKDHRFHVWKRYAVRDKPGSVLQYVGMLETGMKIKSSTKTLINYRMQRGWRKMGHDSIYNIHDILEGKKSKKRAKLAEQMGGSRN
ncbi:uncharacterized protein MEPE_03427 [Melanopsichium pennsylvanicum]|uniref:Uncharacterized protein n=1 Tax=Melanopsichium pennsylvanicum TaxID=63383 RepID=A0AAJ5C5M4_9BASI|nr:uncharacterized protein MEPE_03427 [Melanopsichium pennsylvanicum]